MVKSILLFIILISVNVSFSQDTVINYELKQVVVLHSEPYFKEVYSFKKDPSIKDGRYYLFTDSTTDFYSTKGFYKNNLRVKNWESYTAGNDLLYAYKYKKGLLDGKEIKLANNEIRKSVRHKNGLRQGIAKYYVDGKKIAKGKYSNKYVDVLWTDKEFIYSFSNGETLKFSKENDHEWKSMLATYDIVFDFNRIWLRKGTWKLYSPEGKVIQRMKYTKDGKLIYKKIYLENNLELDLW